MELGQKRKKQDANSKISAWWPWFVVALSFVCLVSLYGQDQSPTSFEAVWVGAWRGDPAAQLAMGRAFANGDGVLQDYVQAYVWFNLATSKFSGAQFAASAAERNEVSSKMTAGQIAQAQKLARDWKPRNITVQSMRQPVLSEQQQAFCSVFQEDGPRRKQYAARVAAAKNNPIAQRLAEQETPDFDGLLRAQEFAVMGKGGFQNWFGRVILTVDLGKAYVAVEFPCRFTTQDVVTQQYENYDNLYFGDGFGSPPLTAITLPMYREGVPIDSAEARALATLTPGEAVAASGTLSCVQPAASVLSAPQKIGCEAINAVEPNMLWARITSIRALTTGRVFRVNAAAPAPDNFDRVNALRKGTIRLYQSDDIETMREKARALVWQKPSSATFNLAEFLFSPQDCGGCIPANTLVGISLQGFDLDASGKVVQRQGPCPGNIRQPATCADEIVAVLESDMPALKAAGTIENSALVPGPDGKCYLVRKEDQFALHHRTERINALLEPLGMRLEPSSSPAENISNNCAALNRSVHNQAETAAATAVAASVRRAEAFRAVSVTVTAAEFGGRLRDEVKARALSLGVDPLQYEDAIATVDEIARLCSSITEAEFAESMDRFNQPHLLRYKNGKFKDCIPTGIYRAVPEPRDQPGLLIRHDLRQYWDATHKRWSAAKLHIDVFLKPVAGDKVSSIDEAEARYIALSADIANTDTASAASLGSAEVHTGGTVALNASALPPESSEASEHTVKLTPASPLGERDVVIVAPPNGFQNFNIYYIDVRDFTSGGMLNIDIQIARTSATDGSFDLFPSNIPIPTRGDPTGTLVGSYNVRKGKSTRLEHRFTSGQVFVLGLEGNWFSPKGATGQVHFRASVRR